MNHCHHAVILLLLLQSPALLAAVDFSTYRDSSARPEMVDLQTDGRMPGRHFLPESGDFVGSLPLFGHPLPVQEQKEPSEAGSTFGMGDSVPQRRSLKEDTPSPPLRAVLAPPPEQSLATRTISGVNLRPGSINISEMLRGAVYPPQAVSDVSVNAPPHAPSPAPAGSNNSVVQAFATQMPPMASLPQVSAGQDINVDQRPTQVIRQLDGLNVRDTVRLNNLPVEPPNPAVCVGNGYLVQVTNYVLAVHDAENGTRIGGPLDLPSFFGVVGPPSNGVSDPYCLYDEPDSHRFFISMMYYTCTTRTNPDCSNKPVFSYVLIAVSKTENPLDGFLGPYYVDTSGVDPFTLQPYPGLEACAPPDINNTSPGCLGDYPTPGMDQNAFWFGVNLFSRLPLSDGINFVGALVFGVRKLDLISGGRSIPPRAVYYDWSGSPGFTIVPSITQATNEHWTDNNGTVFLVSSDIFTFSGLLNSADGVPALRSWAITHTDRIAEGFPDGAMPNISEPVTMYTEALQYPSVEFFDYEDRVAELEQPAGQQLDARDERLRQVSLSGGLLWTCLNTAVSVAGTAVDGLAYFAIQPAFNDHGVYTPTIINQGYVRAQNAQLINGGITATREKTAIMTGSLFGQGYFLSPFFVRITLQNGPGVLRVPKLSTQPLLSENGVQVDLRTGDYSTAALDEQGRAWLVAQYAGERNASAYSPTNDRNRTLNWATWIMQVDPTSP